MSIRIGSKFWWLNRSRRARAESLVPIRKRFLGSSLASNRLSLRYGSLSHLPYLADVDRWNNSSEYYPLALHSDGTSGDGEVWAGGAKTGVEGMPVSVLTERFNVPTSNPAAFAYLYFTGSVAVAASSSNNSFFVALLTSGGLRIDQRGASGGNDYRRLQWDGFRAAYSGQLDVSIAINFSEGDSTTAPTVMIAGVDKTSEFTASSNAVVPNWMDASMSTAYQVSAADWPGSNAPTSRIVIGALSDAEAADWTQPDEPTYESDFSAGVDGNTGSGGTISAPITINGSDNWLRSSRASGTGQLYTYRTGNTGKDGRRFRIECTVFVPVESTSIEYLHFYSNNASGSQAAPMAVTRGTEFTYSEEFTWHDPVSGFDRLGWRVSNAAGTSAISTVEENQPIYFKDWTIVSVDAGTLPAWALLEGDAQGVYASDFSVDVDGWAGVDVTGTANYDSGDAGHTDTLRLVSTRAAASNKWSKTVTTVVGQRYTFFANYKQIVGSTGRITVASDAGELFNLTSIGVGSWSVVSGEFTATDATTNLIVYPGQGGSIGDEILTDGWKIGDAGQPIIPVYSRGSTVVNSSWGDLQGTLVGLDYGRNDPTFPGAPFLLQHEVAAGVPTGLRLPGVAGNTVTRDFTTPTGDMEFVFHIAPDVVALGAQQALFSQWWVGEYAFFVDLDNTGHLRFFGSLDGSSNSFATCDDILPTGNKEGVWVKVSRRMSDGRVQFSTGQAKGTWEQLGLDEVLHAGLDFYSSSAPLQVGATLEGATSGLSAVKYFSLEVSSVLGGVADLVGFSAASATPYQTTILDTVDGAEWTVAKSAAFTGQDGDGELFVGLPGTSGDQATSTAPATRITGDIDLRIQLELDSYTSTQILLARGRAGYRPYHLYLASGVLHIVYSNNGTTERNATCTTTIPLSPSKIWLRATYATATGYCNFYTSTDGIAWTLLGDADVAITAGAIYDDATSYVQVGSYLGGILYNPVGKIYRAQIYDGIAGTLVWDFIPDALGSTSWVDSVSGQTITVNQSNYSVARFEEPLGNTTHLPGGSGNFVSGPAYIPTSGVTRFVHRGRLVDDTPAATSTIASVYNSTGNQRAWFFNHRVTTGIPSFAFSPDGTAVITSICTEAPPIHCTHLDAVVDWDNGTVDFNYSFDGLTWSALGTQVSFTPAVPLATSTAPLELGSYGAGAVALAVSRNVGFRIYQDGTLVRDYNSANGNANSVTVPDAVGDQLLVTADEDNTGNGTLDTYSFGSLLGYGETTTGTTDIYAESTVVISGLAVRIELDGSASQGKLIVTSFTPKAGAVYRVSVWARNIGGGGGAQVTISGSGHTFSATVTTSYAEYTTEFTSTGTAQIQVGAPAGSGANDTLYMDNISITEVVADYTINSTLPNPACIISAPALRFNGTNKYGLLPYDLQQLAQPATVICGHRMFDSTSLLMGTLAGTLSLGRSTTDTYQLYADTTNVHSGSYGSLTQVVGWAINAASSLIESNGVEIMTGNPGTAFGPEYLFRNASTYANGDLSGIEIFAAALPAPTRYAQARTLAQDTGAIDI